MKVSIKKIDITKVKVEAIVNPSNPQCTMGGGVAKQIHDKGGKEIKTEARKHTPINIGEAVITGAGRLPAKYIIHTPTVKTPNGKSSEIIIDKAIKAILKTALDNKINTIAIPGLGTGSGGISYRKSVLTVCNNIKQIKPELEIILVYQNKEHEKQLKKHSKKLK
ncbi:macro domain-containing protein [Methanonatronarchaeum sp. AMET-Sl]|uniref:macro domain-containing protein n=1 Tax=Methanonatronarchaeum sp. AMET-Sl TaxID=3037654 RepID=UPI00244E4D75|nr:macro domain-containing protein [Methanonatronarchaeum sp. AMET-Sl]WGI17413.1 macro domain-containing protein [Methanonatronarchaeum sp. AMET-Sl]